MATQKSAKPTLSTWLDTLGITTKERETGSKAFYDAVGTYNMIGLQEDNRDWKAIMSSADPEQAAFQATAQAYGGSGTVNLTNIGGMLTSPDGTPLTSELGAYRQFGITLNPADLLSQLNTISRATPAGRAKYEEVNNLYQQALADQKSAGLLGSSVNYLLKDTATKTKVEDVATTGQTTDNTQATTNVVQNVADGATKVTTQATAVASRPANVQKVFDLVVANPSITDAEVVSAMKQLSVSPKDIAQPFGLSEGQIISRVAATVPYGQTIQIGDTIIQPQYRVTGSGETEEIGGLENVYAYRASDNKAGGGYTQYLPDGTLERTGTQMKVSATKDFIKFALTAGALFGGAALAGLGPSVQAAGITAAEAAGLGLTATEAATLGFTGTELAAAGYTAADITAAGLTTTGLTTTGVTTGVTTGGTIAGDVLGSNVVADAATGLTATQLTTAARLGLTAAQFANLLSSGGQTAAGLLQLQTSKEAADKARAMIEAETVAAKTSAQFRPVGMTTRFGTSQFKVDPVTGQLISAGYTLDPQAKNAQDRLVKLAESGLQQAEGAQAQFAPLQTGAQSLFNLGSKYLAKTPEDVAKDYLASQMSLLQPGRELELANLQNKLFQQGRSGVAVAQGGDFGDTTPELQALFNARARQEAELAANAQLAGQRDVLFGAGLYDLGTKSLGNYYAGQQTSYAPYTTALGQVQALETAAQQPLTLGAGLGQTSAQAGFNVGQLGLRGAGASVELATGKAATTNPYSTALSGITSNPLFTKALTGLTESEKQSLFSQTALGSSGFGTGAAYGNQDLGLFL
jgi:hypothetical protein